MSPVCTLNRGTVSGGLDVDKYTSGADVESN